MPALEQSEGTHGPDPIMAACLEEARVLFERLMGEPMVEKDKEGNVFFSWTGEIATIACALYQERCRRLFP